MGLLDILTGMQNGPHGKPQPGTSSGSGGMSPMTMALLGLLAYKAFKGFGGSSHPEAVPGGGTPGSLPAGSAGGGLGGLLGGLLGGGASSGGLGGLLGGGASSGGLGGLLGGAAAGSLVSGGLGTLIKDLQSKGLGSAAQSWVGTGPNQEVTPGDLESAVGTETLDALAKHTGMGRDELLTGLSQQLPGLVDKLTPHGRIPTEEEAQRIV